MRFQVLGPLEVTRERASIPLGGPKQRAVLAHLIVRANQVVPTDALIDQVWGEEPPESARNVLQTYISHLRSALGTERIEGRTPGYILHLEPFELDAVRFESLVREARDANGQSDRAASLLKEALELWKGPAFADLGADRSLVGEIARLNDLHLQALEERIGADIACGRHIDVIGEAEALIHEHPLRERLWGHLIIALYRSGRQTDALNAYQRLREILADELGVDPSPELQRLHERVLRQDPDLEFKGKALRGYRLLEPLGEGAFGVVYRATQPQIGRDVAIKAIHPELANHPDFVRRFEREAQIVARLEHPHIVPLYDYWREPAGAFLVMRYLRGGSLAELIDTGPLAPARAARIIDQIASALAAAHRQGVVHRDVKPSNVLLDEEGNAYLSDFGVALDEGSRERTSGTIMRGTPEYLSPEQVRLDPATPSSDIYALGIVAYEMLVGDRPVATSSHEGLLDRHLHEPLPSVRRVRPELRPVVDDVIARATAKEATDRFPDVLEAAAAFREAFDGTRSVREPLAQSRNPYKGLRAFLEADAGDFFGREVVTERLVQRLAESGAGSRFLAVVGPSGSGKSSIVRAGLVPALRRGALPGSDRWFVVDVLPGSHPLKELESALLGVAVEPPPSLMEHLERDELGLVRSIQRVLPDPDAELVIVLDQFEEVFTLVQDEAERAHVLASLWAAAVEPGSRVRIIATLRADFFDAPLSIRGFGELLAARHEALTPMSPEELERAIVAPADRGGLVVEPALVAAIIADVIDRPSALPLLQYALTELAERTEERVLSLDAYRRIGGVSGALARRSEKLFSAMNEEGRDACRKLFLRLVTVSEDGEETRWRVRRSELRTWPTRERRRPSSSRSAAIGCSRSTATPTRGSPPSRSPTGRCCAPGSGSEGGSTKPATTSGPSAGSRPPLRMEPVRARSELPAPRGTPGAARGVGRHDDADPVGGRSRLPGRQRAPAGRGKDCRAGATGARTIARTEIRAPDASPRRGVRRRRARRRIAHDRGQEPGRSCRAPSARGASEGARDRLPRQHPGRSRTRDPARDRSRPDHARRRRNGGATSGGCPAPSGRGLSGRPEAGCPSRRARLQSRRFQAGDDRHERERQRGRPRPRAAGEGSHRLGRRDRPASAHTERPPVAGLGCRVLAGRVPDRHERRTWHRRDLGRRDRRATGHPSRRHRQDTLPQVDFSPDGTTLLATDGYTDGKGRGTIWLWDVRTGHLVRRWSTSGAICGIAFSPDGGLVAGGLCSPPGRGETFVWDARTGERILTLQGHTDLILDLAWSPDGRRIATAGVDGEAKVWDVRTGAELLTLTGHTSFVTGVAFAPDGRLVATASYDGTVRLWNADTGEQVLELSGHGGANSDVVFSPDGQRVASGGADATLVWDITPPGSREQATIASSGATQSVVYSPDGSRLATMSSSGQARLWDPSSGRKLLTFSGQEASMSSAFGPDGSMLVTGAIGSPVVWDTASGKVRHVLDTHGTISGVAVSPDGGLIATANCDQTSRGVTVWDATSGERVRALTTPQTHDLDFSPDGTLLAAGRCDGTVTFWKVPSFEVLRRISGNGSALDAVDFSPDGTRLATSNVDGTASVGPFPLATWPSPPSATRGEVWTDVTFSPDGKLLATAGADSTARLWDASTGRELLTLTGSTQGMTSVAFSPDGTRLAVSAKDGTVRI